MTLRAVIPAAGFGTRMLPATKSMPKEMLPVLDKPAIQWVVEEAVGAGIDEIVIITGRHKKAVEDHFDAAPELDAFLRAKGKADVADRIADLAGGARILYVRQDVPRGLGHAVLQAEPLTRGHAFAVLLGDDIITGAAPVTKQLLDAHARTGSSVIGVQRVPDDEVSKYGVVAAEPVDGGLHRITQIVEKPAVGDAPSNMAVIGRYVLTPRLMELLQETPKGAGGEIQLTDAIAALLKEEDVYCLEFEGRRFDVGHMEGWLEANQELAQRQG